VRILYHSAAPFINTGYGRCTRQIAGRLHNEGHEVAIQTLSSIKNSPVWWHGEEAPYEIDSPIRLYNAEGSFGLGNFEKNFDDFDADILFTHFDTWMETGRKRIPDVDIPYASYVIVDHHPCPTEVVKQVNNAVETIAMSEYGESALQQRGLRPSMIPHGVDTDVHYPLEGDVEPTSFGIETTTSDGDVKKVDTDDVFLFGMVAANMGTRKNIPNHLEAFKLFLDRVDEDAMFYVHTNPNTRQGFDLPRIAKEIGIPRGNLIWPPGDERDDAPDHVLNYWYNAMDVHMNCSMGESWGLTITESQACGTPNIVTNFSSMPEQVHSDMTEEPEKIAEVKSNLSMRGGSYKTTHGITVDPSVPFYKERVNSKQFICHPEDIFRAMKYYYQHDEERLEDAQKAHDYVTDAYSLKETVVPQWLDLFEGLERRAT